MRLDPRRAEQAIARHVGEPLFGGDVVAAAAGIRRVVDNQMADLIRKTTLERGYDTRNFVMMAYGGAGPTHAASYGSETGCREIIIPAIATVHSAYGAAMSDIRFSLQFSDPMVLPVPVERLAAIYDELEARGAARLDDADVAGDARVFERWVEARYRRQVHNVRVPVPALLDAAALATVAASFHATYERLFGAGSGLADAGIELINYGVEAIGQVPRHVGPTVAPGALPAARTVRPAWCAVHAAMVETPVYDGTALPATASLAGPAIIEQPGTTVVVLTGQHARVGDWRHIHLTDEGAAEDRHA